MAARAYPTPHHPLLRTLVPLAASHPIRTASHSSLHSLVAFSLAHLSSPSAPPLVLHTLPPPPPPPPGDAPDARAPLDPAVAVAALPKLVSLHQLVLRASPSPLHSYTLVDSFERHHHLADPAPPSTTDAAEEHEQLRQDLVALEWLSGRAGSSRRPRRKHTPLMLIVVSPVPLSLPASFTHQPPQPLSRNAKRALKRPAPAPAPPPPPPAAAAPLGVGDEAGEKSGSGGDGAGTRDGAGAGGA
ncbi:hypothetical protein JCM9279_001719, partial [Rhodotorula babjevae]